MPRDYDAIDLFWDSTAGDFALSPNGDILSTQNDPLYSIAQTIVDRVKSDKGDWKHAPYIGASLGDFVGERNSSELGEQIRIRIYSALQAYSGINTSDISVDVFPLGPNTLGIEISLAVLPTVSNKSSHVLKKLFYYEYSENNILGVI